MSARKRIWTAQEDALMRELYPDLPARDLAHRLRRGLRAIYARANTLGLCKSEAFRASDLSGRIRRGQQNHAMRKTQFKPGMTPWNKGKHYDAGEASARHRFPPGQLSGQALRNLKPVGYERINDDGIRQRKINDDDPPHRRWKAVHALLWEQHRGPIPRGHIVVFKDGDATHIALDNLECISRAELMRRNSVHQLPKELADLVQLRGALMRQIHNRERHQCGTR